MTGSFLPPNSERSIVPAGSSDLVIAGGGAIQPISVVFTSAGQDDVVAGYPFELGLTLQNQGDRDAVITVHIDSGRSPILGQWCRALQKRVALGSGQSGEVAFIINVPGEALPRQLEYDVVIDATATYSALSPIRRRFYLQVRPAERFAAEINHPTFQIQPETTPSTPIPLRPGLPFNLNIWVENRSERVDRFRLEHLGIPHTWQATPIYPKTNAGQGLIVEMTSLGLNPGDRDQIVLQLTPPLDALAGSYVPTLRIRSQNNPDLNLLSMVYLQVEPVYLLQPSLQVLRNQVRQQPALFDIQLVNEGNSDRQVRVMVENLDAPDSCAYTLCLGKKELDPEDKIELRPKDTRRVRLQAMPQQKWRRPLFGAGRFLNFRVDIEDTQAHPIPLNTLQGTLIWQPRPWWQFLLLLLTAAGAIASLIFLIWWVFFRPPLVPRIISFEPQDARYDAASGDAARVNWQIEHPQRIQSLEITGYDPEGLVLSGPFTYDFGRSFPSELEPFCAIRRTVLTCENVPTGARQPGQYKFELTLTPKGKQPDTPIALQTNPVLIDLSPQPQPQVVEFFASELIYVEAGAVLVTDPPSALPPITDQGIQLNWAIAQPEALGAIKIIGRDAAGKILGERSFPRQQGGDLFAELGPWCELEEQLICRDVPTPVYEVGEYQFELIVLPKGGAEADVEPQTTEIITIQPQGSQILSFQVNGDDAQPTHLFPINQPVVLSWEIVGGTTTTAMLSPVPGDVPLIGSVPLPVTSEPGSTTFTLQVNDGSGESFTRSVTIETFDPDPYNPNQAIADAIADGFEQLAESNRPTPTPEDPALGEPGTAEPSTISPSESPPRFNR